MTTCLRHMRLSTPFAALLIAVIALAAPPRAKATEPPPPQALIETPSLRNAVKLGDLPPVSERLPQAPRVLDPTANGGTLGRHGGTMRWLMGKQKDVRMVVYYGYARLVGYNLDYDIVPDILERVDVEDARQFTLHIRPGHRWSDGHPFTAEDFRYFWEDVANDKRVGKGIPAEMLVDDKPPQFEIIDETTVRYTWHAPNAEFLPALAATLPLVIAMPAHHLKQYHPKYADAEKLKEMVEAARVRNARSLHIRKSRATRPEDPELPVLDPWINTTEPPSSLFVFKRNPYYHRVDVAGRQLPYIDEVHIATGSTSLIPAKTGTGESDLQARYLRFDDYTFLRAAQKLDKIRVSLWERSNGSHIAIVPNLNAKDPVWRKLNRDVRFRRALSHGINRAEINAAIFYGLARESANTVLPGSPLYKPEYAKAAVAFDLEKAGRLLDELGLDKRDYDGIRLLPDGRRAEIILETSGESTEEADVLSLIKDSWRDLGIAMFPRPTQRDLFRQRASSGETIMTVWSGLDNGLATSHMAPNELAPVSQAQLQWPQWGLHYETNGKHGTPPEIPAAKELLDLKYQWLGARSDAERRRVWHRMLQIHAENIFTIGIVNGTKQPVAHAPDLRNVPEAGIFSYQPGGYFGVYHPDTFYFADEQKQSRAPASTTTKAR
jgi:peptide/nickel transport system substrate-binding protein